MSLQFYMGESGSGKSTRLYEEVNKWALNEPERNYLFIVPDQYTMSSQIELVRNSPCGGIMNVEVLSFQRLAHRVFEETGYMNGRSVLDDTGKSLILRAVASSVRDKMPFLGGNLDKTGFIHEIKSIISEFKQYDIPPEGIDRIVEASQGHGLLISKLNDIKTIYSAFNEHISSDFITTEETMTLLTEAVEDSDIVKNAVIILDGFTGFTPVQYRLIQRLLELTSKVIITITIDIKSGPYTTPSDHELFYLSKKTIRDIQKLSEEKNIVQLEDVKCDRVFRFQDNPEMAHLQKNIFRYDYEPYPGIPDSISICECDNIRSEIKNVCIRIKELVLSRGLCYRDVAVVCADLDSYADGFNNAGEIYDIPFFIDRNSSLKMNPFVEFLLSSLLVVRENFSYRSVMHFIKSGLMDEAVEDIDEFDNYILAHGIKGKSAYSRVFTASPSAERISADDMTEDDLSLLNRINSVRSNLMTGLNPLLGKNITASDITDCLLKIIDTYSVEDKLEKMKTEFEMTGQIEKASEYRQIYGLIIDLIGQIRSLIGEQMISLDEFIRILESGIEEIDIGRIPGGVDRVTVGDITRSRISNIKVLFLMGVNDGNIPMANTKGGIISDIDREFLKEQKIELAPTPSEQIYTQRLYLYMIMSKPTSKLVISYSRAGNDGKSIKESYLISQIRDIFPNLELQRPDRETDEFGSLTGMKDAMILYADALREYADNDLEIITREEMATLGAVLKDDNTCSQIAESLENTAFFEYKHHPLTAQIAEDLYGKVLTNSVSRLEQFAMCQYAHFLRYGLRLKERQEFTFERKDLGTVYHGILSEYAQNLGKEGYSWTDCPKDVSERILSDSVRDVCTRYGSTILYSTYSNRWTVQRIEEIMTRTVNVLKKQLQGGEFIPEGFETEFSRNIRLDKDKEMRIKGRIDRIDICEKDGSLYIKIIDYKSGSKDIELDSLFYGLQLQQPVYMMEAIKQMAVRHPNCIPRMAAMFYYHIDDPILTGIAADTSDNEIEEEIDKSLKPSGLVNDDRKVIKYLDSAVSEDANGVTSGIIPVSVTKSGELAKNSKVISEDKYQTLSKYTDMLTSRFAGMIIEGNKEILPAIMGDKDACRYCSYRDICTYDEKCAGYTHKKLDKLSDEDVFTRMDEECRK